MTKRSTYVSAKQHTRVRFTPLTWSCALRCITPQSPCSQKFYIDGETAVDRTQTPCCIRPVLTVYDPDGIMDTSGGSKLLSATAYSSAYDYVRGHEWYVDGEEISSVWTEGTDYEITYDTSSVYNGMLTIYKNLSSGQAVSLTYRGVFADSRMAMNRVVTSNAMELNCIEAGVEEVGMSVSPSLITYDPIRDGLLLYEYLVGQGVSATYSEDGQEYLQEVTARFVQGTTVLDGVPDGYTLQWVERESGDVLTTDLEWVEDISDTSITFDLRCVDDAMIEAQLIEDETGVVLCRASVDIVFSQTSVSVKPKSAADIGYYQDTYENEAIVSTAKGTLEYPDAFFDLRWYLLSVGDDTSTESDEDDRTCVGYGATLSIDVDDIGMDKTTSDGGQFWLQIEGGTRDTYNYLLDDDDDVLTDDDDNILIA